MSRRNGLEISPDPVEYLRLVYIHRFRNAKDRIAVNELFNRIFQVPSPSTRPRAFLTPEYLQIGHSLLARSIDGGGSVSVAIPHEHLGLAESVLKSIEMGWLVILAGSSGIGKRRLIRAISSAAGRPLGEFAMHPGVDTSEILGSFEQQDFVRLLNAAVAQVMKLLDTAADLGHPVSHQRGLLLTARDDVLASKDARQLDQFVQVSSRILEALASLDLDISIAQRSLSAVEKAGPNSTGFAWIDGQLLTALREGGWYHISNANLCSASVLDRLNSLCENDGVLVLSEKGSETGNPEIIKPHPDFRLFMTFDPRYGELSRAMRNRGVELYMDEPELSFQQSPAALDQDSITKNLRYIGQSAGVSDLAVDITSQSASALAYIDKAMSGIPQASTVTSFLDDMIVRSQFKKQTCDLALPPVFSAALVSEQPNPSRFTLLTLAN